MIMQCISDRLFYNKYACLHAVSVDREMSTIANDPYSKLTKFFHKFETHSTRRDVLFNL